MTRVINILVVDDNQADADLVEEVLNTNGRNKCNIYKVEDGQKALDFVNKKNGFEDMPMPNLIILDINLPLKNGIQVLEEIKNNKNLKHIPIVIYTASEDAKDVFKVYTFQANSYVVKSFDNVKNLAAYWLKTSKLD